MSEGSSPETDDARGTRPTRRYLRAESGAVSPSRTPASPFARFFPTLVRLAPSLLLVGIVTVVLIGRGFWPAPSGTVPGKAEPSDTPVLVPSPPDTQNLGNGIDDRTSPAINPNGTANLSVPRNADTSPAFTGYFSRPGSVITTVPQRIGIIPARRDETLAALALRTGAGVSALMYANGITDPERPLAVGQTIRVPPAGTMLHHVKESDTLEGIARAYGVKPEQISAYPGNSVQQSSDLVPGAYLIIPTTSLPVRDRVVFYQVRDGDTLGKISALYALNDARTLQWANSLSSVNLVRPGQVIAIPPTDGLIHVVEGDDTRRTTDDAVTQIAKNFACTSIPCKDPPTDDRVNKIASAIFAFGPNHLTHGGKLIPGQEIIIPNGIPYVEPPPIIIPQNVRIDNPDVSSDVTTTNTATTTTTTTTSGGRATVRNDTSGPSGSSAVARAALRHLGEYRRPDGVPWAGWCEMFVGNVANEAGAGHYRFASALADAYAGPIYRGRAPAGALVFFDGSWNAYGHVGIAMGDGTMVSALYGGVIRSAYEGPGYLGWRPFP